MVDAPAARQRRAMRPLCLLFAVAIVASCASQPPPSPTPAHAAALATRVYVVGTLYRRHASVAAYGIEQLRAVIAACPADAWVLDVSPAELRAEQVHASKIEYPGAIFPLRQARGAQAYPGEPDEPMFSEIVQATVRSLEAFKRERAAQADALKQLEDATYAALAAAWTNPADAHSDATVRVLAGLRALSDSLAGAVVRDGWERWNQHIADVVRRAAAEHPGRAVLVLVGIANRGPVIEHLRGDAALDVVAMEPWLRAHLAAVPQ